MAGFNFGTFAQALASTEETGVTFEGKAKNWGTEQEGKNTARTSVTDEDDEK